MKSMLALVLLVLFGLIVRFGSFSSRRQFHPNYFYFQSARGLFYYSSNCNYNKKFISNFTLSIFNDTSGGSFPRVNASGTLKVEVVKFITIFDIHKSSKKNGLYDTRIMRGSTDSSNVLKGNVGNFIVTLVKSKLSKYSNFVLQNPQKPQFYHMYNYPIFDNLETIPKFFTAFLTETIQGKFSIIIKAKVNGAKQNFENFFQVQAFGSFEA